MKAFGIWLLGLVLSYGALGGGYHVYLSANPKRVAVVVDSSFAMKSVWDEVPAMLDLIDDRKYTSFALLTEKATVHAWTDRLKWTSPTPYAPRDFSRVAANPILNEAEEVLFVTNARDGELDSLPSWEIIRRSHW